MDHHRRRAERGVLRRGRRLPDQERPRTSHPRQELLRRRATGNAGLNQNVDVSSTASVIDTGQVGYHLSGWLGGYASQNDRVTLSGTFLDGSGHTLGTTTLGPVTNTDRANTTKLLSRTASGNLPTRTRTIKVALAFTWSGGSTTDGYADDLSLTLSTPVPAPVLSPPPSTVPRYDHVFVVYMENENYKDIIGNTAQAPHINKLANANTVLTQSYATSHPSDPNYVWPWQRADCTG
ncbi:hypothetical protein ACIBL5_11380 [Streptomyces sp. NPDC050516]|uniref:hypothetical protein n=1 Tax=Streptomyces sp. NPDC050516 TaxID=3365621 RepID=UPI00378829B3